LTCSFVARTDEVKVGLALPDSISDI